MRHEIHELQLGRRWLFCDAFRVPKLDSVHGDAALCTCAQIWCMCGR